MVSINKNFKKETSTTAVVAEEKEYTSNNMPPMDMKDLEAGLQGGKSCKDSQTKHSSILKDPTDYRI